jgi:hypothetical protein
MLKRPQEKNIPDISVIINTSTPFLVLNCCGTQDAESEEIKERGNYADGESTACISEWGFSPYV